MRRVRVKVSALPFSDGELPRSVVAISAALASAREGLAEVCMALEVTECTSVTELLRNACVNCGLFPIVATAGRLVNVVGFLESNMSDEGEWVNVDLMGHRTTRVIDHAGLQRMKQNGDPGVRLFMLHATTVEAAQQLFGVFARDRAQRGEISELVHAGFKDEGLAK